MSKYCWVSHLVLHGSSPKELEDPGENISSRKSEVPLFKPFDTSELHQKLLRSKLALQTPELIGKLLINRFKEPMQDVSRELNNHIPKECEYSLAIAGGAFRSVYDGTPISDLDIFLICPDVSSEIVATMFCSLSGAQYVWDRQWVSYNNGCLVRRVLGVILNWNSLKVQLMFHTQKYLPKMEISDIPVGLIADRIKYMIRQGTLGKDISEVSCSSVSELLEGFDFIPCMAAVSLSPSFISECAWDPSWELCVSKKLLRPNPLYDGPYQFSRIMKYVTSYGYTVENPNKLNFFGDSFYDN